MKDLIVFDKIPFNEKYDYILLCQSFINLYDHSQGKLPIQIEKFTKTDDYFRIDEDLKFFREIEYLKNYHTDEKIKAKYQKVYDIYKNRSPLFFEKFESDGFLTFNLNNEYTGSINPFELLAEKELNSK